MSCRQVKEGMVLQFFQKFDTVDKTTNGFQVTQLHCAIKGIQMGVFLGGSSGLAVSLFKKYRNQETKVNVNRIFRFSGKGMLIGFVFTNLISYYKLTTESQKNNKRGFLLVRNRRQTLTDDFTLGGILLSLLLRGSPGGFLGNAAVGGLSGLVLSWVYLFSIYEN